MIFDSLALLSLGAAAVSAAPTLDARQFAPGPQCSGLGIAVFDIAYNFTLAAYNVTGPNTNDTGVPLVLGQAGAVDGASFKILSTYASYPFNDWPTLSMIHGGLWGNTPAGVANAQGNAPVAGDPPSFIVPPQPSSTADPVWCGVASTSAAHGSFPQLAVNGSLNDFWLCPASIDANAQVNVVYKPSADNFGQYLFDECFNVQLHILEQE